MSEQPIESSAPIAEIHHGPSPFEKFLDDHQGKLIIGGIIIIVVLGVFLIASEIKKTHHAKAGAAFAAARDMPALREVVDTYSDTPAAGSALLKLSQMQWQNAEQKESIETLQNLLATYPEHPLVTSATAALASHHLELGELDKAKENFKKVVDNEDHLALAPLALLSLGDIARREGKLDEARKFYEQIKSEKYSEIAYSSISAANDRIALLGVAGPEKESPKISEPAKADEKEKPLPTEAPEETPDPVVPTPDPIIPTPAPEATPDTNLESPLNSESNPSSESDTSPADNKEQAPTELPTLQN